MLLLKGLRWRPLYHVNQVAIIPEICGRWSVYLLFAEEYMACKSACNLHRARKRTMVTGNHEYVLPLHQSDDALFCSQRSLAD